MLNSAGDFLNHWSGTYTASGNTIWGTAYDLGIRAFQFTSSNRGADAVLKKLGSGVTDLGTGTSFDVSGITGNYQNLTIDNFIVEINSFSVGSSNYYKGTGNCWPGGYYTLVKNYDPSTGILTAYGRLKGGYSTSTAGIEGWVEKTSSCHAYLVET